MNRARDNTTYDTVGQFYSVPAWLDMLQSLTGLFLALFMWAHMAFVSSILISKDAMYAVTRFFEGEFIFGRPYPAIVTAIKLLRRGGRLCVSGITITVR